MLEKGRNRRAGQEECDGVEEQPVTVALYASDSEATCVAAPSDTSVSQRSAILAVWSTKQ